MGREREESLIPKFRITGLKTEFFPFSEEGAGCETAEIYGGANRQSRVWGWGVTDLRYGDEKFSNKEDEKAFLLLLRGIFTP